MSTHFLVYEVPSSTRILGFPSGSLRKFAREQRAEQRRPPVACRGSRGPLGARGPLQLNQEPQDGAC